jgi:hypothetical protein
MRQANNGGGEDVIKVSISRFGHSTVTLDVPVDSTVSDTLALAGIETQGNEQVFVAGTQANGEDILDDGDIVSVVTPKQAGTR